MTVSLTGGNANPNGGQLHHDRNPSRLRSIAIERIVKSLRAGEPSPETPELSTMAIPRPGVLSYLHLCAVGCEYQC